MKLHTFKAVILMGACFFCEPCFSQKPDNTGRIHVRSYLATFDITKNKEMEHFPEAILEEKHGLKRGFKLVKQYHATKKMNNANYELAIDKYLLGGKIPFEAGRCKITRSNILYFSIAGRSTYLKIKTPCKLKLIGYSVWSKNQFSLCYQLIGIDNNSVYFDLSIDKNFQNTITEFDFIDGYEG